MADGLGQERQSRGLPDLLRHELKQKLSPSGTYRKHEGRQRMYYGTLSVCQLGGLHLVVVLFNPEP